MKRYSIRQIPRNGKVTKSKQVTIISAESEKAALKAFAIMKEATGWHDIVQDGGLWWRGKESWDASYKPDDDEDSGHREWKLVLQWRERPQLVTFLAWEHVW